MTDVHDRMAVADVVSGIPVAENPQLRPAGELVSESMTVPENPFFALRVIFVNGEEPTTPVTLAGLGVMLKLAGPLGLTVTDTLVEFVIALFVPPVPFTEIVKLPAAVPETEQMPVEVPPAVSVRDEGQLTVSAPPVTVFEIVTLPANPSVPLGRLEAVIVKLVDEPALNVMLDALATRLKPVTCMVRAAEVWLTRVGELVTS